jgi:hypothetical protein
MADCVSTTMPHGAGGYEARHCIFIINPRLQTMDSQFNSGRSWSIKPTGWAKNRQEIGLPMRLCGRRQTVTFHVDRSVEGFGSSREYSHNAPRVGSAET